MWGVFFFGSVNTFEHVNLETKKGIGCKMSKKKAVGALCVFSETLVLFSVT